MATLQNLTVRLGMDPTSLMKGAARAQKRIQVLKKDVEKSTKSIRRMSDSIGNMSSPTGLIALTAAGATASKVLPIATAALLSVPAAAGVAGAAFATLATATGGMSDAMEALADGDAEKIAEAMKNLSPAAQETVKAMHGVRTSFDGVRKAVQESVFAGMADQVRSLGATYLPILERGMVAVGGTLNALAKQSAQIMSTPLFQGAVAQVFDLTKTAVGNLTPVVTGLLNALPNLIAVGAPLVDMFTKWLGGLVGAKLEFLSTAEGMAWMQAKIDAAKTAFSDLGGVLGPIWQAVSTLSSGVMMLIGWFNSLPPGVQGVVSSMIVWGTAISFLVGRFAPLFAVMSRLTTTLFTSAATQGGILNRMGLAFKRMAVAAWSGLSRAAVAVATYSAQAVAALGRAAVAGATYVAKLVAQGAVIVARWAVMAAGAMARAVVMAAAWFVALGPVGWVIAIVIGLVALIIANWDKVKAFTISAFNAVWSFLQGVWNNIVSAVKTAATNVWQALKSGFERAKNAVMNVGSAIFGFVRSIPGRILGALGNLGGLLVGAGRAIMDGLRRGIEAAWNKVKGLLQKITNMIPDWKGPMRVDLKLLEPTGKAIMHGLTVGIDDGADGLQKQLHGITNSIGSAVKAPASSEAASGGPVPMTAEEFAQILSGARLSFDDNSGRVLARIVNHANTSKTRRG